MYPDNSDLQVARYTCQNVAPMSCNIICGTDSIRNKGRRLQRNAVSKSHWSNIL